MPTATSRITVATLRDWLANVDGDAEICLKHGELELAVLEAYQYRPYTDDLHAPPVYMIELSRHTTVTS